MKICLHTFWDISHDFIGGTERFLIELAKELKALGYQSFIACTGNDVETTIQGVPVYGVLPPKYLNSFAFHGESKPAFLYENFVEGKAFVDGLKELAEYTEFQVNQFDSDLIHLNSFSSSMFFSSQKPVIVTNHENEKESNNLWGDGFFKELESLCKTKTGNLPLHHAVVVPSFYYAKKYTDSFKIPVQGINQGVNLSTFPDVYRKTSHESMSDVINVLLPSRLEPNQKGHDIALDACKKLVNSGLNIKMIFSGVRKDNQQSVETLRKQAIDLGILNNIVIKSFSDIKTAYNDADIVISPERYCSYGLSVSESLAVGKPTVLSNIPTYKEIAEDNEQAHFFKSGCSDSLASTMKDVINKHLKINNSATIKFRTKYDFRECAKKYSDLYINAIEQHS